MLVRRIMKPEEAHRPKRIPNPQVLNDAEQYFRAYRILEASHDVLLPTLQTGAIALELYLKCLGAEDIHIAEGEPSIPDLQRVHANAAHSHELVKLLQEIPADTRTRLRDAFEANPLSQQEGSFEKRLGQLEGLFFDSRYPFEEGRRVDRYPPSLLQGLLRFLHEFAFSEIKRQTSDY